MSITSNAGLFIAEEYQAIAPLLRIREGGFAQL